MPGTSYDPETEVDSQDQAEVLDETHTVGGEAGEIRTFGENPDLRTLEEMPDVEDVTRRVGDRDDEEAEALDASEFDAENFDDTDLEEDDELDYHAVTEEYEDDLDGLGPEAGSGGVDEDAVAAEEIEGLDEVREADAVTGGEDDFTNFQAKNVGDEDLKRMGYARDQGGETRARPKED